MGEVNLTLRVVAPRWRRAVVAGWVRCVVLKEMLWPGTVDMDREAERMARFLCRVEVVD